MDGGEPDRYLVNLDGSGLRLPDEPNPSPVGAGPDSLLRSQNLAKVLAAARKLAPAGARITNLDVRPERVGFELDTGSRELSLDFGYDAVLTSRDLRAKSGPDSGAVSFEAIDPGRAGAYGAVRRAAAARGARGRPVRAAAASRPPRARSRASRCTSRPATSRAT